MKSIILSIALLFSIGILAQEVKGVSIEVTVDNLTNNEGKVVFALHTSETFMVSQGVKNAESKIEDGKVTVIFDGVAPGSYAIMALHDQNENGRMDYEPNGMPKESYGTSNNTMSYGPPQFAESKFEVREENQKITIRF